MMRSRGPSPHWTKVSPDTFVQCAASRATPHERHRFQRNRPRAAEGLALDPDGIPGGSAQGLEVDFVVPGWASAVQLIECKASGTPPPAMAAPLLRLAKAFETRKTYAIESLIVHEARSRRLKLNRPPCVAA